MPRYHPAPQPVTGYRPQPHAAVDAQIPGPSTAYYGPPRYGSPTTYTAPAAIRNGFAWYIALSPTLFLLAGIGAVLNPLVGGAMALATVLTTLVSVAVDTRRVKRAGARVPSVLGYLATCVYLFMRSSRLEQSYAIPIVYCVGLAANILLRL